MTQWSTNEIMGDRFVDVDDVLVLVCAVVDVAEV